jgi:hypothetical protein
LLVVVVVGSKEKEEEDVLVCAKLSRTEMGGVSRSGSTTKEEQVGVIERVTVLPMAKEEEEEAEE